MPDAAPMTAPDDKVTAELEKAQRIADALAVACRLPDKVPDFFACGGPVAEAYWSYFTPARITSLLAAISDLLKPHQPGRVVVFGATCERHEAHRHFSITGKEADDVRACPDCTATVYISCTGCPNGVSVDACPVRETITSALTGAQLSAQSKTSTEEEQCP